MFLPLLFIPKNTLPNPLGGKVQVAIFILQKNRGVKSGLSAVSFSIFQGQIIYPEWYNVAFIHVCNLNWTQKPHIGKPGSRIPHFGARSFLR